jgi:hypothetical protein
LASLAHVDDLVGDLLLDDQLVLGINGHLHVVAHGNMGGRRHRPAVGISERDLVLAGAIQLRQQVLASPAPGADGGDLLGQGLDPRATYCGLGSIALIKTLKVIVAFGVGELDKLGQRGTGEGAVLRCGPP